MSSPPAPRHVPEVHGAGQTATSDAAAAQPTAWHALPPAEVEERLATSATSGLSSEEALARLQTHGPNALAGRRRGSVLRILLRQFSDVMVLVLATAAVLAGMIGEPQDTIAIAAILVLNAVLGFVQEFRAERALEALGLASSFLRCDDPALITEIAAAPVAGSLELRKIAPTVLVSPLPLIEVLDELRKAGYSPTAEGPDGQILDLRQPGRRVPAPVRVRRAASSRPPTDDQLAELVRTLRAGDRASGGRLGRTVTSAAGLGATDTAATVALLREAIALGNQVWIWFVDGHGTASQRIVDPFRVGGGLLEGRDVTHGAVRQYPLHRITAAALVDGRADPD